MKKLLAIFLLLFSSSSFAQVTDDYHIWLPVNINAKLGDKLRGFMELQPRITDDGTHLKTAIVRPALGYAVTPEVTVWAGYLMQAVDDAQNSDDYSIENRAWQGVTYKTHKIDDYFIFEVRNRLEERFLPGNSTPAFRWRTRFRGEYLINTTPWSIIASEEIFANLDDNENNPAIRAGADQNRAYVGVGYRFAPQFQVETGYLNQQVWGYAGKPDANNHVWMSNLNFNF